LKRLRSSPPHELLAYETASRIWDDRDDGGLYGYRLTPEKRQQTTQLISEQCLFCSSALLTERLVHRPAVDELAIGSCDTCGWWRIFHGTRGGQDTVNFEFVVAEAQRYDVDAVAAPIGSLRRHLRARPTDLAFVHPTTLERLISDCLEDEFAPCEVIHLGGTGDGGVDLMLIESDRSPLLIQVKRRADILGPQGLNVVRELNGVLFREGLARGMVVTTADRYTRGARAEAVTRTGGLVSRYEMRLRAFDDIVAMLQLPRRTSSHPWVPYLAPLRQSANAEWAEAVASYLDGPPS